MIALCASIPYAELFEKLPNVAGKLPTIDGLKNISIIGGDHVGARHAGVDLVLETRNGQQFPVFKITISAKKVPRKSILIIRVDNGERSLVERLFEEAGWTPVEMPVQDAEELEL